MIKRILPAVLAALALSASAETKIATINMELVVLAHPLTATNKVELQALQKTYIAERDAAQAEGRKLMAQYQQAISEYRNEALSESRREKAKQAALDLEEPLRKADADIRRLVADRQRSLRRQEMKLFSEVLKDIRAKVDAIAKEQGLSMVVDSSAERSSAPIPLTLYADPALDISDAVIAATGGDRAAAEESIAKAEKILSGEGLGDEDTTDGK